jgi:hypothetical protein
MERPNQRVPGEGQKDAVQNHVERGAVAGLPDFRVLPQLKICW